MKLSLYIDGKQADLSAGADDALILWTYTRDDADAPAAVKNSYTKTITLPACEANATIFGHAGVLDRVTTTGMYNALAMAPFVIYADDGRILERGYVKLDKIARRGEVVLSYDVTLYGGLGGFFYALTYNADGTKRSLADIRWLTTSYDVRPVNLVDLWDTQQALDIVGLKQGWDDLIDGSYRSKASSGIVNYVPANNGIPDGEFDAGKAFVRQHDTTSSGNHAGNIGGVKVRVVEDNITYQGPLAGGLGVILDLGNKVTEWEAQCFCERWQRRAWNVARFLQSLVAGSQAGDFGDWTLVLDSDFFNTYNPYYWQTWVTLDDPTNKSSYLSFFLTGSKTPADYLLGFAKMFGLVFVPDIADGTITLMSRNKYYNTGLATIDLSDRVAKDADVQPFLATARMYDFAVKATGAFAEQYASTYKRQYGDYLLDSNFPFDASTIDVMKSLPFNGCADVRETSPWYFMKTDPADVQHLHPYIKFVEYGVVTYQLYNYDRTKSIKVAIDPNPGKEPYYPGYRGVAALPQFHDADGKRIKAPDVMLFLCGKLTLPQTASPFDNAWHIGTYSSSTETGGKTIWNLSLLDGVTPVTEVPYFRRWIADRFGYEPGGQGSISLDFGDPKETATGGHVPDWVVFVDRWQRYMQDRFDRDTMVLKTRVDLSGLDVGPSLLRRFFYYRGSIWSLNKVTDFNPAKPGITQCEFVRVKEMENYTAGQETPTIEY